jgi:hypothetical protein
VLHSHFTQEFFKIPTNVRRTLGSALLAKRVSTAFNT